MQRILCKSNEVLVVGVDVWQLSVNQQKNLKKNTIYHNEKAHKIKPKQIFCLVSYLVLGLPFSLSDVSSDDPLRLFSKSGVRA